MLKAYAPVAAAFGESGGEENIEINAEDPEGVYILDQPIGLDFGYGPMSIETQGGYYVSQYGFDAVKEQAPETLGKVENGVINFPVLEKEASSGAMIEFQIWLNMGGSSYFGGRNKSFQIVLPGAPSQVMKKAKSLAKASEFESRMFKNAFKADKDAKGRSYNRIVKQKVRSFATLRK